MKIAVIGSGAAGLITASSLSTKHSVILYEMDSRLGGHAHTATVNVRGNDIAVDTGFIVYNTINYPYLTALFRHLGVQINKTTMDFSVYGDDVFNWSTDNLNTIFGNFQNITNFRYLMMLREILRFNRIARTELGLNKIPDITLGDYLAHHRFRPTFVSNYLLPMASAIWSSSPALIMDFPARTFVEFFDNHRLLHRRRPPWRTVRGGSVKYVEEIVRTSNFQAWKNSEVLNVVRTVDGIQVVDRKNGSWLYDAVVMACHADTALAILKNPTPRERATLQAFKFRENKVVLHGDISIMPADRKIWSSWNCRVDKRSGANEVSVTYNMNRLQHIETNEAFLVTLNPTVPPRDEFVYKEYSYSHPQFDVAAISAQAELEKIQGVDRIWFAGAYWKNGFHEDAVRSAINIAKAFECVPSWAEKIHPT